MSDKKIFPLTTKILLRADKMETVRESGIVITGGVAEEYRTATALRVGPDCKYVKEGYKIYVNWNKALDVKINGTVFCFLDEEDVIAIVDKDPEK
jgi:co-chaperonin GroES (HSP10)